MKHVLLCLVIFLVACGGDGAVAQDTEPSPTSAVQGCGLSTAWAGDEACLSPSGVQLHFGPSDYDDPKTIAPYLAEPGSDATYTADVALSEKVRFVAGYTATVRPGNHHLSLRARTTGAPNYTYRTYTTDLPGTNFVALKHEGKHESFSHPPEYEGAAIEVPTGITSWVFDVHYINTTDKALLMEGWVNLDVVEAPSTKLAYFQFSGGTAMNVAPHTRAIVQAGGTVCAPPEDVRLVTIGSHAHSHSQRVSAFVGGKHIYTNIDWSHALNAEFNSETVNAPLNFTSTGAVNGVLAVSKGTPITWECDIDNDLSTAIRYGSNLKTAEMCVVCGFYTAPLPGRAYWECTSK